MRAWDPQEVGFVVLRLALRLVASDAPVAMTLDDTLARHTGKHIASAGMHRDPLLSTANRPFFHFGHKWVVLAIVVTMPWGKRLSLPVLSLRALAIIEGYCQRWSLEETFGWVKGQLGFEDPHNRVEHAVHRTAPMALWCYSLVVIGYVQWSRRRKTLPMRAGRWYRDKTAPSFADMLATLRRQCWVVWVSDRANAGRLDQTSLAPLLDVVGYG